LPPCALGLPLKSTTITLNLIHDGTKHVENRSDSGTSSETGHYQLYAYLKAELAEP